MPYIIMKRNDIPDGTLQVLDMEPNTSLRNLTLDGPGQTKYVNAGENDVVVTTQPGGGGTPILLHREARGLAAWFITNVNDGTGAAATGGFTVLAGNAITGDMATVDATAIGGPSVTFTFVAGAPAVPTEVTVGGSANDSALNLVNAINLVVNGLSTLVTAAAPGGGVCSVTADQDGTAGNSIATTVVSGGDLTAAGATLAGGVDANALTAADANTNAANVLTLLGFGDLAATASALDLATVNGALATGTLTVAQHRQMLDILAGREYVAPRGVQVDSDGTTFDVQPAVGAVGGPDFVAGSLRPLFNNDGLPLSFVEGQLSVFRDNSFDYAGVAGNPNGEAVVVYNDDGSLYTP
jgi:hypothetical protein